ncbi:MAG: PIN domain-containing protein [Planctomycetota bacterium]
MRTLLDTSVIVPALVARHPHHAVAIDRLRSAGGLRIAAHSLAEAWAVLTRLPSRPRISGGMARKLLRENLTTRGKVVSLTVRDHEAALERADGLGLAGGAVFDVLVVQAALKAEVDRLVTFNGSDFRRVWPEAGGRLEVLA